MDNSRKEELQGLVDEKIKKSTELAEIEAEIESMTKDGRSI